MSLLQAFRTQLSEFFFPAICAACSDPLKEGEEAICLNCIMSLPYTDFHLHAENPLMRQFKGKIQLESAAACFYFHKAERIQHLLHQIKYKRNQGAAFSIGKTHGEMLKISENLKQPDVIIPVPLHPLKLKQRGYNQSEEYGNGIAHVLRVPLLSGALKRIKAGGSQTFKTRMERFNSLKGSFQIADPKLIRDRHILLVDDVITSGATVEICAGLLQAENCRVSIASVAFTQSH